MKYFNAFFLFSFFSFLTSCATGPLTAEQQERRMRGGRALLAMASAMNAATANANTNTYTPTPSYAPSTFPGFSGSRYAPNSLANPYGAGSPYKRDGLMNPFSRNGSQYSNNSWTNPYATNAPKIYGQDGSYHGRLSSNKYDPDSTSNPYGRYGSRYSSESLNNPYGAGNPYSGTTYYVKPQ